MLLKRADFLLIIGPPVFLSAHSLKKMTVFIFPQLPNWHFVIPVHLKSHFNLYFSCVTVGGVNTVCILVPSFVQLL